MDGKDGGRPQPGKPHEVTVVNRETAHVTGVLHVDSFDDHAIVLDTDLGTLTMTGQDLQIKQLDLEEGRFSVEGLIHSVEWSVGRGKQKERAKGFLARMIK